MLRKILIFLIFRCLFLKLDFDMGERINESMVNYVKGSDRLIAKRRWFLDRELGGYGLIDIHKMDTCVKSAWINKWIHYPESIDINGRRSGSEFGKPVDQWNECVERRLSDPLTTNILCQWKKYKKLFYEKEGQIGMARLFENDGILDGVRNIGHEIFGNVRYNGICQRGKMVRVHEVIEGRSARSKAEIEQCMDERLNMAEYFRLRNITHRICGIYGEVNSNGKCLDEFIRERKRGGGALRRAIVGKLSTIYRLNDPRAIPAAITFWGNNLEAVSRYHVEIHYGLWGMSHLSVSFKNFLFNMLQGRLYLNNVLVHMGHETDKCTFCLLSAHKELAERGITRDMPEFAYYTNLLSVENVNHLFWQCNSRPPGYS